MHIYTVEEITEADFGCEETGRDKPMAMLKLREDTTSEERYVEVSEEILARQKISAGKIELRMAEEFKANAIYLEPDYPKTAKIFFGLFETYKREAERERVDAENGWL